MNLSSLYKQLKKRLRQKRRWLSLGFFIVAAAVGVFAIFSSGSSDSTDSGTEKGKALPVAGVQDPYPASQKKEALRLIGQTTGSMEVYVRKAYVCGEETQLLGMMHKDEVLSLYGEHPQWDVQFSAPAVVTFTEPVDDLSPACKSNAFFGLDKNGNLTLFDGPPEGEKVIRTFFQLNMGYLESSLPRDTVDQLREGIPVIDMAEYNSVLSTFSDFAVEETEQAMKAAQ